jgi:hypothetical protein
MQSAPMSTRHVRSRGAATSECSHARLWRWSANGWLITKASLNGLCHCTVSHTSKSSRLKWNHPWNNPAKEHFTLLFLRLSKVFNCRKMIGSYARWWNDLILNGVSLGYQSLGNSAYEFHHGETLFFSLLSISYKTCLFADVSPY